MNMFLCDLVFCCVLWSHNCLCFLGHPYFDSMFSFLWPSLILASDPNVKKGFFTADPHFGFRLNFFFFTGDPFLGQSTDLFVKPQNNDNHRITSKYGCPYSVISKGQTLQCHMCKAKTSHDQCNKNSALCALRSKPILSLRIVQAFLSFGAKISIWRKKATLYLKSVWYLIHDTCTQLPFHVIKPNSILVQIIW